MLSYEACWKKPKKYWKILKIDNYVKDAAIILAAKKIEL